MFDAETTALIQSAIPLDGLDLERLPQELTEAYALVVSARLGAAGPGAGQQEPDWRNTTIKLRRLAETYEGLTIFLPPHDIHRSACAFVAGSAHFTLHQARRLRMERNEPARPSLSPSALAPEVAAALLFLIGEHHADAAETAKTFSSNGASSAATQLLQFLASLASGSGSELQRIVETNLLSPPGPEVDYLEAAAERVWLELARAVQFIASRALGIAAPDPRTLLDEVIQRLSGAQTRLEIETQILPMRLPLAGPYHLARLLITTADVLLGSTVTSVRSPGGISANSWSTFTGHFARKHPFLWRNHSKAISEGFIETGSSFVLTFPTGAGKTTLTQLRIAAELLRGRAVVYLTPTRALVDQVTKDISAAVRPLGEDIVRGRFLEDFGEQADARVYVQTPEQCLAYLSFEADAYQDLGLIVVDECHQLSGERPDPSASPIPGRRAVDAMWALLSILQRSPNADVVLISAMVRNGTELARWLEAVTKRPARILDLAWKPTRQVRGVVAYEASVVDSLKAEIRRRKDLREGGRSPGAADKRNLLATPVGLFCHTQVWNTTSTFAKFPLLTEALPLALNKFWGLSANRNQIGGRLLGAMARAKMRPIVFSQRIDWTKNIAEVGAKDLDDAGVPALALTQHEEKLFQAAGIELGDPLLVERPARNRVGVHHGLLLVSERVALESAFRRTDGLLALVATPTVAQGINLPAEAVIIAGDDRWAENEEEGAPETLAVHELLNAAGRAGRAGHYAHGIVIDLPGKVFSVKEEPNGISFEGLSHVMGLFGLPDQCLDVVDPLTQVIDRIAAAGTTEDVSQYLVRRIGGLDDKILRRVLATSLGNALVADRDQRADTQAAVIKTAATALNADSNLGALDTPEWREFACQSGVSLQALVSISESLPDETNLNAWSFSELLEFHIKLITNHPGLLFALVDPNSAELARIMPRRSIKSSGRLVFTEEVTAWEQRWNEALLEILPKWLSGAPLKMIGEALHRHRNAKGHVKAIQLGRRFAVQAATGLGHGTSVIARLIKKRHDHLSATLESWLRLVPGCMREGFNDPDKLLLFWSLRRYLGLYPRVRVHQIHQDRIAGHISDWQKTSDLDARKAEIRRLLEGSLP